MKIKAFAVALAVAGFAASFAFADNGGNGKGGSAPGATTTTGKGKSGQKCKNVSLQGTAPATSFTVTVAKASNAAGSLRGKPVTLTFTGKVHVNAFVCTGGAGGTSTTSTFQLRNLKVAKPKDD